MEKIVSKFLKFQKVPISARYVEKIISSHPDYPSLLSIADGLERLGIDYKAWKTTREQLTDIAFPYLLPISSGGGGILFVKNENDLIKHKEKLNFWDGVILQTDPTKTVLDKENNKLYSQEKFFKVLIAILLGGMLSLVLLPFFLSFYLVNLLLLVTALFGAFVGYLLVAKDLGVKYSSVESFCNAGKNTNCDKILNSEDAKILGVIKFSDAVLTYFAFQLIMLSSSAYIPGIVSSVFYLLLAGSLLTIPIILFSIHYQYFKAKAWCKLCLVVNALLFLQVPLFFFVTSSLKLYDVTVLATVMALFVFVLLGSAIVLIKELINRVSKAENVSSKANRLKNSIGVFTYLLSQQRKVDNTPFSQELLIGNPDAPIQIIMASNLYCNPCKVQHQKIAKLISNYPEKINLTIRFLLSGKDVNRTPTTNQYLIQYWKENISGKHHESANTANLLHDWFAILDLEKFKTKYSTQNGVDDITKSIESLHLQWIESAHVTHTPTFFINGYQLPNNYSSEDLMTLIPNLSDHFSKMKNKINDSQLINA